MAVDDHSQGLATCCDVAYSQVRIINALCTGSDHDSVGLGPESMGVGSRLLTGNPLARSIDSSQATVERGAELPSDERTRYVAASHPFSLD
jgi:hypothetical protein